MAMGNFDKSKFKFSETFNNSDGKTSGSGFIGVLLGLTAILTFIVVIVGWWLGKSGALEVMEKIIQLTGLSALLMGVRKVASFFNKNGTEKIETKNIEKKIEETIEVKKVKPEDLG